MTSKEINILLVEDDDVAAEAVMRSLKKHGVPASLTWAQDGQEALEVLRGQQPGRSVPRPRLVLLDLNMPRMNGLEFLDALRADEELSNTVVFVLTTSDGDRDRSAAYQRHVAGYIVKTAVGNQFSLLCQLLNDYAACVTLS